MSGPRVFLDISFENSPPERIEIQLYAKPARAVENFRALCAGDTGRITATGKKLHYKGCEFYRIFPGIAIEAGDFENQDGTGGESIYGKTFSDENLETRISGRGILMMQNYSPNIFGSQFLICLRHHPSLDRNVAVGKVIKGMRSIELINRLATPGGRPYLRSVISDCGEILNDNMMIFDEPQGSSVGEEEENETLESHEQTVKFLTQSIEELKFQIHKLIADEENENWFNKVKWPVIASVSTGAVFSIGTFFWKAKK